MVGALTCQRNINFDAPETACVLDKITVYVLPKEPFYLRGVEFEFKSCPVATTAKKAWFSTGYLEGITPIAGTITGPITKFKGCDDGISFTGFVLQIGANE